MDNEIKDKCEICLKSNFKYTCPKCNILYCSVVCYKSPQHNAQQCSEAFYKTCIEEQLSTAPPEESRKDMCKIYDILKRIREDDAGLTPEDFYNAFDSDDERPEVIDESHSDDDDEEEDNDIAKRLQGIDINDADEVWASLTPKERADFGKMIATGDIMKLLPDYKPWWQKNKNCKIIEISSDTPCDNAMPKIAENIPKFATICSKLPSPCLHFNLWNILSAYACMVRFFNGEHLTSVDEAVAHLVNLSATLKYGTNFEDAEDANISVEMEAKSTGNGAPNAETIPVLVESREQLKSDARQLMSVQHYKLAALSDLLQLFKLAKEHAKNAKLEPADFHKLFALCSGSVELNYKKLQQIEKKMLFYLSYVNRNESNNVL